MAVAKLDQYLGNPNLKKGHTKTRFTKKQIEMVKNPESYLGIAVEKTEKICNSWKKLLK